MYVHIVNFAFLNIYFNYGHISIEYLHVNGKLSVNFGDVNALAPKSCVNVGKFILLTESTHFLLNFIHYVLYTSIESSEISNEIK